MNPSVVSIVIVLLLWAVAIYLSLKTSLLKDISDSSTKPYSFSRTQLLWWTLIIASCYILAYGHRESLPLVNNTCLALLGIGLGTTTLARVVDNTQINQTNTTGADRHQNEQSQGFFTDLISDETGISVHRFQTFIFNAIFGVSYFTDFFNLNYSFPTYDNQQLLLLGISSGAYIALKMNENSTKGNINTTVQNAAANTQMQVQQPQAIVTQPPVINPPVDIPPQNQDALPPTP